MLKRSSPADDVNPESLLAGLEAILAARVYLTGLNARRGH